MSGDIIRFVKDRLITWLSVELAVAAVLSASICVLRPEEKRAYRAWRDAPTPETRKVLDKERATTRWHQVVIGAVLFGGMALVTVPVIVAISRRRRSEAPSDPRPTT